MVEKDSRISEWSYKVVPVNYGHMVCYNVTLCPDSIFLLVIETFNRHMVCIMVRAEPFISKHGNAFRKPDHQPPASEILIPDYFRRP